MVPGVSRSARAEFRNMELGAVGRARVASLRYVQASKSRKTVNSDFQVPSLELRHDMQLTRILQRQSSETSFKGRSKMHVDWQKNVATSMVQKTDREDRTRK
jgi:hypothetical protein